MRHLTTWFVANVWPNLVASAIWGIPAGYLFLRHHLHMRAHLNSLHTKVDALLGQEAPDDRT